MYRSRALANPSQNSQENMHFCVPYKVKCFLLAGGMYVDRKHVSSQGDQDVK